MEKDLVNPKLQAAEEALKQVSPSMCLAKWLQVTLHLHNGQSQSCHHVKSTPIQTEDLGTNPSALHNTPLKLEARKQMLAGEKPKECSYCWKIEERGRLSDRVIKSSENWSYPYMDQVKSSGLGRTLNPRYVEISFDSICNFKCMYCGPSYSTAWMKELEMQGPYPTSKLYNNLAIAKWNGTMPLPENERKAMIESFWRWWPDLVQDLHHFRITGGEPLLASETWKLFDWLEQNPQPKLYFSMNSNMSLTGKKFEDFVTKVNAILPKVARFSLYTSLDTIGPRAEYIRHGLSYERWVKNVITLLERAEKPITLSLMVAVNALSLSGTRNLMALVLMLRRRFPRHRIGLDTPYVQNPQHMSVEILTKDFIRYIDEAVAFMKENEGSKDKAGFWPYEIVKVDRIRELILNPSFGAVQKRVLRRDFYLMFKEYDRRRKTDFHATFPEYAAFWKECARWAGHFFDKPVAKKPMVPLLEAPTQNLNLNNF